MAVGCGDFERLGDNLVLRIFTCMELQDVFKIRLVCKPWSHAILTPEFIKMYNPVINPWCVFRVRTERPAPFGDGDPHDFNSRLDSHAELWIPGYTTPTRCPLPLKPLGYPFVGLCSSGGLVCGRRLDKEASIILVVGNPLINAWRTLPPAPVKDAPRPYETFVYMKATTATEGGSTFKVVLLHGVDNPKVLEYNSGTNTWKTGPRFSPVTPGRTFGGSAFFSDIGLEFFLGYDPEKRAWSCRTKDDLPDEGLSGFWDDLSPNWSLLFEFKGKHYMVAWLLKEHDADDDDEHEDDETIKKLGLSIWKMEQAGWVLVSRCYANCERDMGEWKMLQDCGGDAKVEVVGSVVVISMFYGGHTFGNFYPVAFDLVKQEWIRAYAGYDLLALGEKDVECCYSFLPSLAARP